MAKQPNDKSEKKNKDLVASPEGNKPPVPSTAGVKGRGLENVEREDILLPRIKLLQAQSPEVTGELEMKAGTILANLTGRNYGTKITLTPILHFRSRIKWTPRDDGGGIDCSSPDAKTPRDAKYSPTCAECKFKEWDETAKTKKEQAPECTLFDNFLVLVNDEVEPIILPMERTKSKIAKKLYSIAALKGGDFWLSQYVLETAKETNSKDEVYYNYQVTDPGLKTPEDRAKLAERLWESLHTKHFSDANAEGDAAGAEKREPAGAPSGKF